MSEENAALVRRLHDLFNGRDLEGLLELLHPEVRVAADTSSAVGSGRL